MKKNGNNTVSIVTEIIMPLIKEQELILWDVKFEKEGSMWILRIIIDKKPDGVAIEDCEKLSRPFDKILDEKDPIDQSYCLEVASAGIERELSVDWHFQESIGKKIKIKLIRSLNGEREFIGKLLSYDGNSIGMKINDNDEESEFIIKECSYIRWCIEF